MCINYEVTYLYIIYNFAQKIFLKYLKKKVKIARIENSYQIGVQIKVYAIGDGLYSYTLCLTKDCANDKAINMTLMTLQIIDSRKMFSQ